VPAARRTFALLTSLTLLGACSSGDGTDLASRPTGPPRSSTVATTSPDLVESVPAAPVLPGGSIGSPETVTSPAASSDADAGAQPSVVSETGVPGLDSDDPFCAAWSRFGGSYQVVASYAGFGGGDDAAVAAVEVAAAPSVADAYADLSANWPDELVGELDLALDEAFGPFAQRLAVGRGALTDAGATGDDLAAIDAAWLATLAARDPDDPVPAIDLGESLQALVDAAVPGYLDAAGTWREDDSLVTEIEIPATNAYLSATCPDQGTLTGQEVG